MVVLLSVRQLGCLAPIRAGGIEGLLEALSVLFESGGHKKV